MKVIRRAIHIFSQIILPILLLVAGVATAKVLIETRPEVPREHQERPATLVSTMPVSAGDINVRIEGFGTVRPAREVRLAPEISGIVIDQNPRLITGGRITAGEELLRIDPRDYELAIEQQRGNLEQARLNLEVERGRRVVAEREWSLLESEVETTDTGRRLALREPYLAEREAAVRAAESRLRQAEINLERTVLTAPFNAIVTTESVETGQYLSPQSTIASLVGTDEFHLVITVPREQLAWIQLPDTSGEGGAAVTVTMENRLAGDAQWNGSIIALLPEVDPNGRLARLLVSISDPLAMDADSASPTRRPLLLNSYVRASVEGPTLEDMVEIPREALREGNRVWIYNDENKLEFRDVEVLLRREDTIVLRSGLSGDERLVTTSISTPLPGMALREEVAAPATTGDRVDG